MNLQKVTSNIGGVLSKNSPTILTAVSVVGLLATVVMAVRATPKVVSLIEAEQEELEKLLTVPEIIKVSWKCYIPTAVTGLLTASCIIGSNKINMRRNVALLSAYSLSESILKEYQSKVIETIGTTKERQIKDGIAKDRILKNPVNDKEIVVTGIGETLCYDALSGRYFKSDIEQIRKALNDLSRQLMSEEVITLNEVYYKLGLTGTKIGESLGWHLDDGLIEPDFSSQLTENGSPCLVLDYSTDPRYTYRD